MRIRMLKKSRGAEDGFSTRDYLEGTEHNLGHSLRALDLARVFVKEGWAEEIAAVQGPPTINPGIRRLPLIEEFIARGYLAEHYQKMIKEQTRDAEAHGLMVEIRAPNEAERAEDEGAKAAHAAEKAKSEKPTIKLKGK